jgi:hypothetical protein
MPARRPTRQTAEQKRKADMELTKNGIALTEAFLANHPTHQNADKARQTLALLQSKLQAMGA